MTKVTDRKIQPLLLEWFQKNKRSLPWRKNRDPYRVWVSEIMLQQTQVDTVLPYYRRWMKRFPSVGRLAATPLSQVLKLWEGLGYYARARNLHKTAKIVTRQLHRKFPASAEELRKLPGIGRYTAGAISSIAFNQPEPVLDGNVKRVLSRLFALKEAVDTRAGEKKLWEISRDLVVGAGSPRPQRARKPRPYKQNINGFSYGDLNQSLMELGALVCLPENPRCGACPVENLCEAHRLKRETEFPVKLRNQKTEKLKTVALVAWKNGQVLLEKQPLRSRWGGLWMFPQWILSNGKDQKQFLQEKAREDLRIEFKKLRRRIVIEHGFTKYRVKLHVYDGDVQKGDRSLENRGNRDGSHFQNLLKNRTVPILSRWIEPQKISRLPLPAPHQKIARQIQTHA